MRVYREHAARRRRLRYFMGMGEISEQIGPSAKTGGNATALFSICSISKDLTLFYQSRLFTLPPPLIVGKPYFLEMAVNFVFTFGSTWRII